MAVVFRTGFIDAMKDIGSYSLSSARRNLSDQGFLKHKKTDYIEGYTAAIDFYSGLDNDLIKRAESLDLTSHYRDFRPGPGFKHLVP